MSNASRTLSLLPETFAICRLAPMPPFRPGNAAAGVFAITQTQEELSIICPQEQVLDKDNILSDTGLALLKLEAV